MSSATSINSIFLGEVASVQSYGAFVKIPGSSNQGLVHRSQISKVNVPDVSEVLAKGDRVWCKIISSNDEGKIGLSMKVVDQGTGKDLDPNGVQAKLDEQRRKEWVPGEKRKTIALEAVFNTTCSKCGTRGHLSKDCFQVAGGKTYDLIPEEEVVNPQQELSSRTETATALKERTERRKEKKEAKKARKEAKKERKAAKKLKKKLKKEAKKAKKQIKKKKKSCSSSDSESSSVSSHTPSSSSSSDCETKKESKLCSNEQMSPRKSNLLKSKPRRSRSRSNSNSPARERKKFRSDDSFSHHRDPYKPRERK